jgi:chromosome partitioning protein
MDYDLPDGGRPPEGVPDDQPPIATSEPAGFTTDAAAPEAPLNPPSPAPTAADPDPSEIGGDVELERAVITELEAVEEIVREGLPAATRRPLPRVIAIANQKGGVGKTTTAVNLGACLAELGHRTLVVDLDPQGNASTGLGINPRGLDSSMYDVLLGETPMEDCIEGSSVRNLFVAPASLDLAGAEIELVPAFSRELRLRNAIDSVKEDYEYVLIDCPPSLGLLTINAFAAASEVLVPIQCEYYALEGLGQLVRNVDLVKRNLNDKLEISTIVLVMYDARTKLADQVAGEVRDHFGEKVCRQIVPRTVRLSEAPSFGQPIITFDPSSRGSIAYRQLAKEVSGGAS